MTSSVTHLSLSLALCLAACGGVACGGVSSTTDAGPGEDALTADGSSSADARVFDAGPRIVTVTVYTENGVLLVGTPVIFHHADGSVQVVKLTDAAGTASEIVDAGAAVTAVVRPHSAESPYPWLASALGLQGGEALVFGNVLPYIEPSVLGTMTVTVPGPPTVGAQIYSNVGCTSTYHDVGAPSTMTFYSTCPATLDFVSLAYDATAGQASHYSFTQGVPFVAGGTVVQPAWRNDFSTTTFNLSGIPAAGVGGAQLSSAAWTGTFQQGLEYESVDLTSVSSASVALRMFNGFPTLQQHSLRVYGDNGSSGILWAAPTRPAIQPVNLTADLLPFISGETVTGRVITFTQSVGTAVADLTAVQVSWTDEPSYGQWVVFAPPDLASIALPTLPADLGQSAPGAAATFYARVGQIEFDGWPGYADALGVLAGPTGGNEVNQGRLTGILKTSLNQRD